MWFRHSSDLWRDFPQLVAGVAYAEGPFEEAGLTSYLDRARDRLVGRTEAELPEIQAWRRAFAQLGLKPTQYRCAAESLLRRFRKEDALPRIHPMVDLCNAVSAAYAIPVAALDLDRITLPLEVRYATGDERYLAFSGETEHPAAGEVVFADADGRAHARRWTNRQSAESAMRPETKRVLIVAEALHETAAQDVRKLLDELPGATKSVLTEAEPVFELPEG